MRILWLAALLTALPVWAQARTGFAQANNISLRYDIADGTASPIVLLHEIGMSLESWDEVVPLLRGHHKIIRYDLRGFGLSQKFTGPVTLADEVNDLHGLLTALGVNGKITLVGGAVGGNVALAYAAQYPDQVTGVIDFSPIISAPSNAPPASSPITPARTSAPMGPSPADIIEKSGMRAYMATQADSLYPPSLRTQARYARFMGLQMASDPISRVATVRMASGGSFADILPKIRCPALMVATIYFALRRPSLVADLAAALPKGEFLALPTGHLAALEAPDLVAQTINDFQARLK